MALWDSLALPYDCVCQSGLKLPVEISRMSLQTFSSNAGQFPPHSPPFLVILTFFLTILKHEQLLKTPISLCP